MTRTLLIALCATPLLAADPSARVWLPEPDLVKMWKTSRDFTLEVAARMPAEHYAYKPATEQMSFGQQMLHIAQITAERFEQLSGQPFPKEVLPNGAWPEDAGKETVLKLLTASYDYAIRVLPSLGPEHLDKTIQVSWRGRPAATGRQMVLNLFVHAAHHRAAAEVYMRLKGVEPPQYTF